MKPCRPLPLFHQTIIGLQIALILLPANWSVAWAQPTVTRVTINQGDLSRSTVTNIVATFNTNVTITPPGLVLQNLTTRTHLPAINLALTYDATRREATWTFPGLPGGSLPDGNWYGSLLSPSITGASGQPLVGTTNGLPGDPFSFPFYRYFGDWNGDRDVDFADTYWLKSTWLLTAGTPGFDPRFDFDGNGVVNTNDLLAFNPHYFTVFPPQPAIFALLVNGAGSITTNPTIAGNVFRTNSTARFEAALGLTASSPAFSNVTGDLTPGGALRFNSNRLAQILGGPLTNAGYTLHLRTVETSGLISASFDLPFTIGAQCPFANLAGWSVTVGEPSGLVTNPVRGSVLAENCAAVMTEGDSFLVILSRTFQLPTNSSVLSFSYSMLSFDSTASNKIKDAFEVALVDSSGNPVTYTIAESRDSFFNASDSQATALAQDVSQSTLNPQQSTISLALHSSALGQSAKLVFRLINNDQDRRTSVRINNVQFETAPLTPGGFGLRRQAQRDAAFDSPRLNPAPVQNPKLRAAVRAGPPAQPPPVVAYNPATEFSLASNPIGVWSYGYSLTLTSPLILHTNRLTISGVDIWRTDIDGRAPVTEHNTTTNPVSLGTPLIDAGGLALHPGPNNELAVLRFTAPLTGQYHVYGSFFGQDPVGTTTDVHILVDGLSEFNGSVTGFGPGSGPAFDTMLLLQDGSHLDFAVGFANGSHLFDTTGLAAQIEKVPLTSSLAISIISPTDQSEFTSGTAILISGRAEANAHDNSIRLVTVNNSPVDVLDASGNFFTTVTIAPGQNVFQFTATDSLGQTASTTLTLFGREQQPGRITFENLSDVSFSLTGEFGRTSFNERDKILFADLSMRNAGQYPVKIPLVVGLTHISDPSVTVLNANGVTPEGIPYFDFSSLVSSNLLQPSDLAGSRTIRFRVPNRTQFTFDLVVLGQLNQAPVFTSIPVVEALAGHSYDYDADATDPDNDVLNYRLVSGPTGMSVNPTNGFIHWATSQTNLGSQNIRIRVEDGRGGVAEQSYVLAVIAPPPNRPPYFVSTPVTVAHVSTNLTELPKSIILSNWSVVTISNTYGYGDGRPNVLPDWRIEPGGVSVKQWTNANASMLLSDFNFNEGLIKGTWRVEDSGVNAGLDDDFIGFVFGYQDERHFYLFDWRQASQTYFGVLGETGMSVKVVNANSPLSVQDLWATFPDTNRVRTILHNTIPWSNYTDYAFALYFRPGEFRMTVNQGTNILLNTTLYDSTFATGKFGFYNYSQAEVNYSGFTEQVLPTPTYVYDADTVDPDGDTITYSFLVAPTNMTINPVTGLIRWGPTADQIGNHNVTVQVSDGRGGIATQSYVVTVLGDPANHPPIIISLPVTNAVARNSVLYVANRGDNTIRRFTTNGTALDSFPAGGNSPLGLVFDTNGNLYVSLYADNVIRKFSPDGSDLGVFANTGLANPAGMVFDSSGNLYVVNYNFPSQQSFVRAFSPSGADLGVFISGFWMEYFIARDRSGNFYLGDNTSLLRGVHKFSSTGSDLGLIGVGDFPSPNYAEGMVFDGQGNLLVVDTVANVVRKFSPTGAYLGLIASTGLDAPRDITLDANGNLFVSNSSDRTTSGNSAIREFSANGADLGNFAVTGLNAPYGLAFAPTTFGQPYSYWVQAIDPDNDALTFSLTAMPAGMTINPMGQISWAPQASDAGSHNVTVRVEDGRGGFDTQSFAIDVSPPGTGEIHGTVFNDLNGDGLRDKGNLLVSSARNDRVLQYAGASGAFLGVFATNAGLRVPEGMARGPDGALYVVSKPDNAVLRFDGQTGAFIDTFITSGSAGLSEPHGMTFGCGGSLYVGSRGNGRVLRYDGHTGAFLNIAAQLPAATLQCAIGPDGALYASSSDSAIRRFDPVTGAALGIFVAPGSGGLVEPHDFIFGPDGDLYAASYTQEVLRYDGRTGAFKGALVTTNNNGGLNTPTAIIFGPDGKLYVSSYYTDQVLRYDGHTGAFLDIFVPTGSGSLSGPDFMVFDFEPGLNGWVVYLDSNQNGRRDPGERFAITDGCHDGQYSFSNLAPGTYVIAEERPPGWIQTTPTNSTYTITITNGQVATGVDFGNQLSTIPFTNRPPTFTSSPPTNAVVGQLFRYDGVAVDPDNDSLTFDLVSKPAGMVVLPTTSTILWIPSDHQVGPQNVILRVQDGRGGVALQSFTITVTGANSTPVITSRPAGPAVVGNRWQYQVRAQDADGDPIIFSLGASPATMTINSTNGLVLWTPTLSQVGTQHVAITASDNRGAATTQSFDLPVVAANTNQPPVITSRPRNIIGLGQTYLYLVEATDPDGDPLTFSLTNPPAGMILADTQPPSLNSRLLIWTPTPAQFGSNFVRVCVSDGHVSLCQQFPIFVVTRTSNAPPEIISTPRFAAVTDRLYAYDAVAFDPDGDPLAWSLENPPLGISIDPALGTVRWLPTLAQLGTNRINVRVTDGQGGVTTQTYDVIVRTVNLSPQIISVPPTRAATNQLYTYAVRANDPEGDRLTFALATYPTNMMIATNSGLITWTPVPAQLGTNSVVVRVTDEFGGSGEQLFQIVVSDSAENRYPFITSTPSPNATVGSNYLYQVTASDPDGDPLSFLLLSGPPGMTLNTNSGLVQWIPAANQLGPNLVSVGAIDPDGAGGSQTFTLNVSATGGNRNPVINVFTSLRIFATLPYSFDVVVTDPDGDSINVTLQGPPGMTMDAARHVTWLPSVTNGGLNHVTIVATDSRGGSSTLEFNVEVLVDTTPPFVQIGCPTDSLPVGRILDILAFASDISGRASIEVMVDGVHVPVDATGRGEAILNRPGLIPIVVIASDIFGNRARNTCTVDVFDLGDGSFPVVSLSTPAEGDTVTAPINVIGTAAHTNLLNYTLELKPVEGGAFTEVARGSNSVVEAVLGRLDPSTLANDNYVLRLTASNTTGRSRSTEITIAIAGELKVGNFRLSFTDLSIPVNGIPITVARTYDTLNASQQGDFGYGWRLEFRNTDLRTSVPRTFAEEDGIFNPFREGSRVYVTVPGGRREGFTFRARVKVTFFLVQYFPEFVPDPGVTSRLTPENPQFEIHPTANGEYVDAVLSLPYNPADPVFGGNYILSTKDGIRYVVNGLSGKLSTVSDPNGNTLTFEQSGIRSSTGPEVRFERDPQDRITAVIDPLGRRITYQYDASRDLVAVTDRATNTTRFAYHPTRAHYLQQVIDPLGRTGVRTEYDAQGRLIQLVDAAGNPVRLVHDPDNFVEKVVDTLGRTNTFEYDTRGNVVTEVNALGGITRRAYDANNNMVLEADPLRNTNRFEYDGLGNVARRTDPLGNVTINTYGPRSQLTSTTDPLGNTTRNDYDGRGNLTATTDDAGNVTRFTYDGAGNQTSITDAAGDATQFNYDGAGHLTKQTDALGNMTSFAYDANGNQLSQTTVVTVAPGVLRTNVTRTEYDANGRPAAVTDALSNTTRTVYDALGNTMATVDALGHTNRFVYDDRGQLIATIFVDGTSNHLGYDPAGRRTNSTDRAGRTTSFEYDALGRLITTIYPDGTPGDLANNPRTRTVYDLVGRVIAQFDERTNRTSFAYDNAGRQIAVTNALGFATRSEYDNAGRKISNIDQLGQVTRFVYDELGRRVQTLFADGTTNHTIYDALGRVTAEADQASVTNAFGYDGLGRLTSVTNALATTNQIVTPYTYNEAGNLMTQRDALGRVTRYEYDGLGRRVANILPLGQRSTTTYNTVGNVASVTDFNTNRIRFDYDANHRLAAKRFPNSTAITYGYTATGRRSAITNALGAFRFAYDARDRVIARTNWDGRVISYTYDLAGNITSITTPSQVVTNTFDALNRLSTVAEGINGPARYTYDSANNATLVQLPNGTTRTNVHDALNRVTGITHTGPGGVIVGFQYTLAPNGNRTRIVENTGRTVQYAYDKLNRLALEAISDQVNGNRTIQYALDNVGNRLSRNDSLEGLTTYAYDDNDELVTETLNNLVTRYTYDANGNTLSRTNAAERAFYTWNYENRLSAAAVTDTNGVTRQLAYAYDDDGIRVNASVDGNETRYLIDANRPFAQVVEEYAPGGAVQSAYVYGNSLISQTRAGVRSYYHGDHLNSTRALTGQAGAPTDQYRYDAYGRLTSQSTINPQPTANDYLFAGEQRDRRLGLDYLRARYLNVGAGRFYGRDPVQGRMRQPISLHPYLYAHANSVGNSDPGGTFSLTEVVATTAIISVLQASFGAGASVGGNLIGKRDIRWDGIMVQVSDAPIDVIYALAESECINQQRWKGQWLLLGLGYETPDVLTIPSVPLAGFVIPEIGLPGFTIGDFTVYSPALFGRNGLTGTFAYGGASAVVGVGYGASLFTMGYGRGYSFPKSFTDFDLGLDISAGFFTGASIPLGLPKQVSCTSSP